MMLLRLCSPFSAQVARRLATASLIVVAASSYAAFAQPTFTVTTLTDSGAGIAAHCTDQSLGGALDASCSLRDALSAAAAVNGTTGTTPVLVNFNPSLAAIGNPATVTLSAGALVLPTYTTLQGLTAGSGSTLTNLITIQGNNHLAFSVANAVDQAQLKNLIVTNSAPAITNSGVLTVSQCTFSRNSNTSGGAISSDGTLKVVDSTFTGNTAASYGAAIYSSGPNYSGPVATAQNLFVSGSTFSGNTSSTDGGAIYVGRASVASVDRSTFTGNIAARAGAAIYINNGSGLTRITNSILTADTGGNECDGVGCSGSVRAWQFDGVAATTGNVRGTITLTLTLDTGSVYVIPIQYGELSTSQSLASAFGGTISNQYYPVLSAQGFGSTLVLAPQSGSVVSAVIDNPSPFTITPVPDTVVLGTSNTVAVSTTTANLTSLGNYGGPTQTVVPLPGSAALCSITPPSTAGLDQRGFPRTTSFGTALCQDAGSVQTSYGLSFVQQPSSAIVNAALSPSPSVQLYESGQLLAKANAPVTMKDSAGALSGTRTVTTAASGIATFSALTGTSVQSADRLTASIPVGAYTVTATSNPFDIGAQPTATLTGNPTFPLTAYSASSTQSFTFTNTGSATITITTLSVGQSGEFTGTGNCGLTLAPGASCTEVITFKPIATGPRRGTFTLQSNATGYTQTVVLTGTAAYPVASLTGAANFPATVVNTSSPVQAFTFANTSTVPVTITGITATGDFSQTNTCGTSLASGQACTISVVFTATAVGARTGTLTVASNSTTYLPPVTLSGTGINAPGFTLTDSTTGASSTAITVAAGSTGTGTLKLTSTNGFSGTVTLACAPGGTAVTGATCSVASPVSLAAAGTGTAVVSITTTSRVKTAGLAAHPRGPLAFLLGLFSLTSVATLGLRWRHHLRSCAGLLLLLCVGVALVGCGTSPSNAPAGGSTSNPNGTPAGTYNYVVTATSGPITATQQVVMTVQ